MDDPFSHLNPHTRTAAQGPLEGLRVAVQPNLSVAGWPAEAGSAALADFKALEDATVIHRLREAGAHLCGTTAMSEFGFGLGASRAAAALVQGLADAELVLDLAGEARRAALRAGVCGFKPSHGLVSRLGLTGLIPSMEAIGLLASAIAELRRVLEVIAGPDDLDFSMPLEAAPDLAPRAIDPCCTTIGVLPEALEGLSRGQAEAFRARLSVLEEAGFALRELPFPEFARFALVHRIVGSVEASSCAGRYDGVRYGRRASGARNWNEMYLRSRAAAFGPLVKRYLFQGAFFQFERYSAFEDACRIRARLKAAMDRLAAQVDVLALPADSGTVAGDGLSLAGTYAELAPLLFANVTGQPALVLPPASGSAGGGLQLTAARRGDGRLLDLGQYLMALDGKGER